MDFSSEVQLLKSLKKTPMEIRKHLTDLLQEEMKIMKDKAEKLHNGLGSVHK